MSRRKERNTLVAIVGGLGWPLLIGAAVSSVFYALIYRGPLDLPLMHRYFASHPVLICETGLFFVGLAALILKVFEVFAQYLALDAITLGDTPATGDKAENTAALLEQLSALPGPARHSYLGRRVHEALQAVQRKGSAQGLDDELKYLADLDAARQQESYGLVRIVIWATPMLGFLGTVIGITKALGDLDPRLLATNIQAAMEGLLSGLYVAFDTTALALTLSMILMFIQFLIDRVETQLLGLVDIRSNELLVGRFQEIGGPHDPHLASVERMNRAVLQATADLVERQVQLWQSTVDAAHAHWSQLMPATGQTLQAALQETIERSLQQFAARMAEVEHAAAGQAQYRWEQWQTALSDHARTMQAQQREMVKQGELLLQVVEATGQIADLERTLNDNLHTLSGAKSFEDMVMSLSAAIHLLTARLGPAPPAAHSERKEPRTKGLAA